MKYVMSILLAVVVIVVASFLYSYPLYLLWNGCLVDAITVVKPVTWLQMWGISILVGFLFKSSAAAK
jgi:hypothetical protein